MDPFDDDRPELTGSLLSIEFGPGGRMSQLWVSDPALPEEGDEFQFILPPVQFGEENAEDYFPGTILIGARTNPDDPWVLSRNASARSMLDLDSPSFDPGAVAFEYEFALLEDIAAAGRFTEVAGPYPQVLWDVELTNRGRVSVEIGELGFPLAFNNFYEGFGWTNEQLKRLWTSRVYLHKFIGGAASWLYAQRMSGETPGLLVFPGNGTSWEFYSHVRASLNTPYQWEGIPIVYAHSKATIEREEWPEWMNDHTSMILEPGDSRTYQMRFVPTEADRQDSVLHALTQCGRPAIRLLPGAVAPADVGILMEVSGATPKKFSLSRTASVETDGDEEGGFCFVKPIEPGPMRVSFEDDKGRLSHAHLMFTEPIGDLIRKRAAWITEHQIESEPGRLKNAITLTNISDGSRATSEADFAESSGIDCSLADACFLAEKNAIEPDRAQVKALDRYISDFVLGEVQNPASHAVGSAFPEGGGVAAYSGRPLTYPHVVNLYHAMYRVASTYGETEREAAEYLERAADTALAMFRFGWRLYSRTVGLLGYARLYELLDDLRAAGMDDKVFELEPHMRFKAEELLAQAYPYAGESVMDPSGLEEVFAAAKFMANDEHMERTARCAFSVKSAAPSWWWYGSDKRCWDGEDSTPLRAFADRGETCLAQTTIPNSLIFFGMLDRDYLGLPEAYMRMAFGGMLGPWALVRADGAASMCFCPDAASKQAGFNAFTGASGLGYFHYLRGAGAFVLPNRQSGVFTFGCHFEEEEGQYTVRPWDGVGRRVVIRQIDAEFESTFGRITEVRLDRRKRWFQVTIENPCDKTIASSLKVSGLWGTEIDVAGERVISEAGVAVCHFDLPARQTLKVAGKVIS